MVLPGHAKAPLFTDKEPTISRASLSHWDQFDCSMKTYIYLKGVTDNKMQICWYWMGLHQDLQLQAEAYDPDLMESPFVTFTL
jgi:hypothetical protein